MANAQPFEFEVRTRIVFGPDRIDSLGQQVTEFQAERVLLVTDPGIVAAGHVERAREALSKHSLTFETFSGVDENPTTRHVDAGLQIAQEFRPDVIVGLGGGSSMDCAKGINFLHTNGGRMEDYWGVGKAKRAMLPSIAVPTTAGTGSEAQSFALISQADTHIKMACGDKRAAFRTAILDPKLTLTQPPMVTALSGIDALAHTLETYVTKPRNPLSLAFSAEAWRLLSKNLPQLISTPHDLEARASVQLGACLAGVAIENSMLGATHALANPLTATYGVTHGRAIGILLPHVIRFNGEEVGGWYRELLEWGSEEPHAEEDTAKFEVLAQTVASLVDQFGLPGRLRDCDIPQENLPQLAEQAAGQWTCQFNPRAASAADLRTIYEQAW